MEIVLSIQRNPVITVNLFRQEGMKGNFVAARLFFHNRYNQHGSLLFNIVKGMDNVKYRNSDPC